MTAGITHVIEHLALDGLPEPVYPTNGCVESRTTRFEFSGPGDVVGESLTGLAGSLRRIADGRVSAAELASAVAVIRAEGEASPVHPVAAEAAMNSMGLRGAGLNSADSDWLELLTVEEIARYASTYFVRENAVLLWAGEPPLTADLSALPSGDRNLPPVAAPVVVEGPCEYLSGGRQASLSFRTVSASSGLDALVSGVLMCLERRLIRELRRRAALIYGAETHRLQLARETDLVTIAFDARPAHAVEIAQTALRLLRETRDRGLPPQDVDAVLAALAHERLEPGLRIEYGYAQANSLLFDEPPAGPEAVEAALTGATPEDVRRCLESLESTLLVGLPEDALDESVDPAVGHVAPVRRPRPAPPIDGRAFGRSMLATVTREPRSTRLVIGDDGFRATLDDESILVRWTDIVALETYDDDVLDGVSVQTADGFEVPLLAATFRKGEEAIRLIRERVPARLQVPARYSEG
ncbi:hypothetical protein GCM10022377_15850 [Zhihengliuella alba]|uniref:Peptidase M16 C-terminal domain-containing protein n=1 Tax=Zhihengliuella alba TaxID=547018 RepID=A0ABP7DFQ9_9MICC